MRIKHIFAPYFGLSGPIWTLFAVQVINRMGDFVHPFLTLFLTKRLGYNEAATGFWVTVNIIAGTLGIMAAGKISDRKGRKIVLFSGMGISALLLAIAGFYLTSPLIVYFLVATSFFQGMVRPAISALIADLTHPDQRKDAYALSYLGINIGVSVGPMIAGFLFEHHMEWLFWGDALSSAAALVFIALFIPNIKHEDLPSHPESAGEAVWNGSALGAFFRRPVLVAFCFLIMVVNVMYTQTHFALPLYAEDLFPGLGALTYGRLMSFNAIVVVAFTPFISHVNRRQAPLVSMQIGTVLYAAGFAMMAFRLPMAALYVSTLVWTLGEIMFSINSGVFMAANTPKNLRGQFQAYREFIASTGRIFSPLLAGLVIGAADLCAAWAAIALLGIAAAAGFGVLIRYSKKAATSS